MEKIKIITHCKINLGLEVLYKRADGYHEINTIFKKVEPHDVIEFSKSDDIKIIDKSSSGIEEKENIIYKTIEKIREHFDTKGQGIKVTMHKMIPVGAGLGGGSSNAAGTIMALNSIWDLNLSPDAYLYIAAELGSDVPFFLREGTAHARGRGEVLNYFDFNLPYWVLIVNPGIHISSKWAYQELKVQDSIKEPTKLINIWKKNINKPEKLEELINNDFEKIVFNEFPEIKSVKKEIQSSGSIFTMMSGSGSSVYGLFKSEKEAEKVRELFPNYLTNISPPDTIN